MPIRCWHRSRRELSFYLMTVTQPPSPDMQDSACARVGALYPNERQWLEQLCRYANGPSSR